MYGVSKLKDTNGGVKRLLGDQEKNLIFYISGSFVIMTDHIDIKRVQPTLIFSFFSQKIDLQMVICENYMYF